ncbi:MAG TPA: hypothetical protein VJT69_05865, partial [Pyrinomonadaceae bacterium]|nr:hypothetical protein [Pyrinomonadaceae bacterium]
SPFLVALQAAYYPGLNVKLTVDLHQNNPQNLSTPGDQFCYGRVLGSIGPALPSELSQVVPGRCLQTVEPAAPLSAPTMEANFGSNEAPPLQARERVAARTSAIGKARGAAIAAEALAATPPDPWNPAFAIIREVGTQTLLSIDIGGCILCNAQGSPPVSDGTFEVDSGISIGVFNTATNQFTPFANGSITISPQYQQLTSTVKNCVLVKNSCVFTFPITAADGNDYKTNSLAIQVKGTTVAQEALSGNWIDVSVSSQRLECGIGQTAQSQIMVRKFGNPVVGQQPPVTASVQLPSGSNSNDVLVDFAPTDANGLSVITTKVNINQLTLPQLRQPLDSQIYYIQMVDSNGNPIGDGPVPTQGTALSVLLFNAFQAPPNPTWNDIGKVFGAYARLYPGMKSLLDISNEATVVSDVDSVLARMSLPISDPAYMPVTRDLSPSKIAMIISWLKQQETS